jgi:hypothetical protein
MNDAKQTLLAPDKFKTLLDAAADGSSKAGAEARLELWRTLCLQVMLEWDSKSEAFIDKHIKPGQRAVYVVNEAFSEVEGADIFSLLTGGEFFLTRIAAALDTLGADEYAQVFREMESKFPGGKYPEYAEDLLAALKKIPTSYFKKLGPKIAKGKGMSRPIHDYVYDYVRANQKQFVRG